MGWEEGLSIIDVLLFHCRAEKGQFITCTLAYTCIHNHGIAGCGYLNLRRLEPSVQLLILLIKLVHLKQCDCRSIQFQDLLVIPADIILFHHHFLFPALHHPIL